MGDSGENASESAADPPGNWPLKWYIKGLVATSIAAILTGFAALYFVYVEREGGTLMSWLMGETTAFGIQIEGPWTVFAPAIVIASSMTLIVWVQRKWFPGTEGTGIPQAIAALHIGERAERKFMLSLRIAVGKTLLLTVALLSGITVGREGPSVHVGACFMHLSSKWTRLPKALRERGLILAGSAAGIAAAFNTPIAGVIFCFEEVGRMFDRKSVGVIVRTVALACAVGVVFLGDYLFYSPANSNAALPLGYPYEAGFGAFMSQMGQWIAVPVVGIVGGFLGGWFGKGVVEVSRFTGPRLVKNPIVTGLVIGLGLAAVGIISSGSSYGGGYAQAKAMLESAHATGVADAAWYYPLAKAGASFLALVSAIPGGLFDPSLATGAGLGQVAYPLFTNYIAPGIGLPELMMLFMAAYFSGVVQSPITVFTIMFEMTGAYGMILPLMFSSIIAAIIAGRICTPSIYEALSIQFLNAKGLSKYAPKE